MKKAYALLISLCIFSSTVYSDTTAPSETPVNPQATSTPDAFITLTRTALSQSDLPTSVDTVTPDIYKTYDAQNAGEAVARETSVQTLPIGHLNSISTARIRGSLSTQTLFLIDGRPATGIGLGSADLSEVPVESIDHIEIVRGGVSALYGPNAIGGVINVITKRASQATKPSGHVGFEMGSYDYQNVRFDVGSRHGPVDYFLSGNKQKESGFRDNSDASTYNFGGNVGLSMGKAGKFMFDGSTYHLDAGSPGTDTSFASFPFVPLSPDKFNNVDEKLASTPFARRQTTTNALRASYLLPLPADTTMSLRTYGSQRETNYKDPTFVVDSTRNEQSKGTDAQFDLPLGLMVGGSFIHDRLDNEDHDTPTSSFIHSVENWGIYAQETFRWKWLTLIPSGRYDHHSQAGETANPRVQMMADATPWLRFSGSAGRSFRAPTLDDLYTQDTGFFSNLGNPDLKPETAWTYDAGFEVHEDSHSFKATYFRANVNDLIQTAQVSAFVFQAINIGSARRQGMELQIDDVFNSTVRQSLNYTYLENLGIPPGFDHLVTLAFSPRHTVNYTLTLNPWKALKLDSVVRYVDSRYDGNDQGNGAFNNKIDGYALLNLRLSYQWRFLETFFGVNDVTNKRYVEQPGYPLPGRTFNGGVTIHFGGSAS